MPWTEEKKDIQPANCKITKRQARFMRSRKKKLEYLKTTGKDQEDASE